MSASRVYFTIDLDPDYLNTVSDRNVLRWEGLKELPRLREEAARRGIRITLFLRVDRQIADVYGDAMELVRRHGAMWRAFADEGHELAWHPHLYRATPDGYVLETDPEAGADLLRGTWDAMRQGGFEPVSVRIGEAWQCNATMHALSALGLRVDSTAVPGRTRDDAKRRFDWGPTPNRPYHPARHDYRVSGGADALPILEVPMTTVPIRAPYDTRPVARYLNPTYHAAIWREAVSSLLAGDPCRDVVLICHPDELMPRPSNDLHSFGWDDFLRNLDHLHGRLAGTGREPSYRTLAQACT